MASLALGVKFTTASAGAGSFVYAAAVQGYLAPASYPMVDGKTYRYRAENPLTSSEWEFGSGVYTAATGTLTRVVSFSSTGVAVAFSGIPQVGIILLPADVLQFDDAMSLTSAQQNMGLSNLGVAGIRSAWTAFTPVLTSDSGAIGAYTATGLYLLVGKTLNLAMRAAVTNNNTGAGGLRLTIPAGFTAAMDQPFCGREIGVLGLGLTGHVSAGSGTVFFRNSDNSYPSANGTYVLACPLNVN